MAAGAPHAGAAPIGNDSVTGANRTAPLPPEVLKRGAEIYDGVCSACHETGVNRAPQRAMLSLMTPESINVALTQGVMRAQAAKLSADDKKIIAQFIAGRVMGGHIAPTLMCKAGASPFDVNEPPPYVGWGLTPAGTHVIPAALAGINRDNVGKLQLKWSLAMPNAVRVRSQPAYAGGAIYVGSHDGTVFALDRRTGCARWTFRAGAEVRTGIVISHWKAGDAAAQPRVYFGDLLGGLYSVNARTGALVWKRRPDEHPNTTLTAAPVLYGSRLFVPVSSLEEARSADPTYACCTFRGSVIAYDAATGHKLWQTFMTDTPVPQGLNARGVQKFGPAGVALWNTPVVDVKRQRLYFGTGDSYTSPAPPLSDSMVALDMKTGKVVWSYQALAKDAWNVACDRADKSNCPTENGPDFDFGAGVVLATSSDGHDFVIGGGKSGVVSAVDPDTGKLVWKNQVGRGGVIAGIHFGMATVGDKVFVPVSDVPDGRTYDQPARPGLYALDVKTGAFIWKSPAPDVCGDRPFCHPGIAAAITATPDLVFAGSDDGHMRIYDAADGKVLWDYDMLRDFKAVNGATAHGGANGGGAAPLPYKGVLAVSSGYGFAGAMGGNAFLVFSVK